MRYFWTFFWTFLLIHMASYVISSMQGAAYDFGTSSIVAIIASVLIILIGEIIPNEPSADH